MSEETVLISPTTSTVTVVRHYAGELNAANCTDQCMVEALHYDSRAHFCARLHLRLAYWTGGRTGWAAGPLRRSISCISVSEQTFIGSSSAHFTSIRVSPWSIWKCAALDGGGGGGGRWPRGPMSPSGPPGGGPMRSGPPSGPPGPPGPPRIGGAGGGGGGAPGSTTGAGPPGGGGAGGCWAKAVPARAANAIADRTYFLIVSTFCEVEDVSIGIAGVIMDPVCGSDRRMARAVEDRARAALQSSRPCRPGSSRERSPGRSGPEL